MTRALHIGKYFRPFSGGIENFLVDLMDACAQIGVGQAAIVHQHESLVAPRTETLSLSDGAAAQLRRVRIWGRLLYAPLAPAFGRELESFAHTFRPDVVHVHVPNASAFWLLRSRALAEIPWVVHWHADVPDGSGFSPLALAYRVYRHCERALLRRAARIIVTSAPYLAASTPLRPWRDKCRVVPLGLKQPQEVAAAPSGREPGYSDGGALKVLFVGRLSRYKGLDYLIRAVQAVPGVEVIVAGEGEEQRRLAALVDRCRLGAAVRLVGGVSEEAKGRLLDAADVLCLPSTSRHEAFGLVLVEAMARGTPVVATRVPGSGMSWVIGDSGAGWTVEPQNVVQLADLLARLRDSTSVREEARRAALDNFRKRFQIADVALRIDQVYQEVLTVA